MRDLGRRNVQDGVVTVFDSLKTGVGSIPIRLAQQQVSARICDTNFFLFPTPGQLTHLRDSSFFFFFFKILIIAEVRVCSLAIEVT